MANELKKPHQSLKPYLVDLIKKKVLIRNRRKNIVEFELNFKNKIIYDYLVMAEKQKTLDFLEKEILLNILFEKLSYYFNKNIFIIFGSAVKNIKTASDIDLLVIGSSNVKEKIEDFENIYNKKVHLMQIKNLKQMSLIFTKELYKKHLILNNTETIIRFFGDLYENNKLV
ncbi:MAG: nucleotidyltransferase domain-containing protein [archaeon]